MARQNIAPAFTADARRYLLACPCSERWIRSPTRAGTHTCAPIRAATVYHLGAWAAILGRAYGFRPRYLALRATTAASTGVLPLLRKKGIVSDARMRSDPGVRLRRPAGRFARPRRPHCWTPRVTLADREGIRGLSVNTGVRRLDADGFERERSTPAGSSSCRTTSTPCGRAGARRRTTCSAA